MFRRFGKMGASSSPPSAMFLNSDDELDDYKDTENNTDKLNDGQS